jgi:tRNA threonylcarbamoyladenosine biosynthesis protein TsaE
MEFEIVTSSAAETIEFGRTVGQQLKGGEVFGISGPLGSGKTHFIKGIAKGAGCGDGGNVNSPTFVLVNEYSGRLDLYHIDAYRLDSLEEFEMIGFDDYCYETSVVLVEWADKIAEAIKDVDYITIELSHEGQNERRIHIKNAPEYIML